MAQHQAGSAVPLSRGKRALLLINPHARQASDRFENAIQTLKATGFSLVCPDLDDKQWVPEALERYADESDLVIVGGGDGSLHYALQGLVKRKRPLGILPLGTANDLAKSLGIPAQIDAASEVIAAGVTRGIDVGCVNGVYFFNEMSVGLSPVVVRLLGKDLKARFGVIALAYRALQVMRHMRRFAAYVSCDGHETVLRTAQLTIGNSRSFGGFVASDEARIDDHRLDLYSVSFRHWWSYLEAMKALLARRYDDAQCVETMHGSDFKIRTKHPKPIEADGEIVGMTPARVRVVPDAIEVFVPGSAP